MSVASIDGFGHGLDHGRVAMAQIGRAHHADEINNLIAVDILFAALSTVSMASIPGSPCPKLTTSVEPLPETMKPGVEPKVPAAYFSSMSMRAWTLGESASPMLVAMMCCFPSH